MRLARIFLKIGVVSAAFLLMAGSFACAGKPLPEGFSADEVNARAVEIVGYASEGDYEAVVSQLRSDLAETLTAETLAEAWGPTYGRVGTFERVRRVTLSGTADPSTSEAYTVARALCAHEKGDVLYTLSFDAELNLVGLYLK